MKNFVIDRGSVVGREKELLLYVLTMFIICKGKWFMFCMTGLIFNLVTCVYNIPARFVIWQSVICCIAIFNLAIIHKRNFKNYTVSLSQTGLEGSY